jgi:N4-gp56 family major capsid protein
MASLTTTTHVKFIPAVWAKEAQIQRESKLLMANLVERHDVDVADSGSVVHIPIVTNLTAGDIGTDGSMTDAANTESEVTITIDKWKGCSFNVPDILRAQSKYDLLQLYSKKMGYALGLIVEQDLLALYDGLGTNSVGTNSTDITDAVLRSAVQKLDDALCPMEDRNLIVKPSQRNALLGIDKFVRYDAVAYGKGESPIIKGNIGELYGVSMFVSPNVVTSAGETKNLMFHKSAFALAMQKDIKVEKFARTQFSDRMGASELYGTAELRDDHAVKVKS